MHEYYSSKRPSHKEVEIVCQNAANYKLTVVGPKYKPHPLKVIVDNGFTLRLRWVGLVSKKVDDQSDRWRCANLGRVLTSPAQSANCEEGRSCLKLDISGIYTRASSINVLEEGYSRVP